jgi:hypothetical protein
MSIPTLMWMKDGKIQWQPMIGAQTLETLKAEADKYK